MRPWFDAHLDLACLAENGRDMTRGVADCGGPWPPASITFRSMVEGGITMCLGTIFTEADGDDAVRYPAGDAKAAHAAGLRQLERYEAWAREGRIDLWSGPVWAPVRAPIALGILMECADPIRTPDEVPFWAGRGVVAIGMAWARGSRYASGNSEPSCSSGIGLTDLGRELVGAIDAAGLVHDISHLSDRALDDLLSMTDRPVIASHSNCRALLDGQSQRHLTDEAIREVGRRGGVIGLNLYRRFIRSGLDRSDASARPTIDEAVAHVEHICEVLGRRDGVGLGSDMDGGFSGLDLPAGIDGPRGLELLTDALAARGWSEDEIHGFARGNWERFWASTWPGG
jgi:membrane dipeptidase